MGTFVEIKASSPQVIDFAFSYMEKLSHRLDNYYPGSDIYRLNKNAGRKPVKVAPETIEILKLSRRMYELTQGSFDPSAGRLIMFWKKKMHKEKLKSLPDQAEIKKLLSFRGLDKVVINEKKSEVFIKDKNIALDLGGIAKGYIVDKTILALKKQGVKSVLINAGGDIYCLGNNPATHKAWEVGIRDVKDFRKVILSFPLANAAIATSGNYEQFFSCCGKVYSHIIDLQSGFPVERKSFFSVSVIAPNLTTADGLATTFVIWGRKKIPVFLASHHSNFRVYTVEKKGKETHIYQYGTGF